MTIIQGQVLDPHGHPEQDASVYIVSAPGVVPDIAHLTDAQGRFTLSAPLPGPYTLGAHSDRWGTTQKTLEVSADEPLAVEMQFRFT